MKNILVLCALLFAAFATASYAQSWQTVDKRVEELRDGWPTKGEAQKQAARQDFIKFIGDQKSDALKTLDLHSLTLSQDLDQLHKRMTTIKQALNTTGTLLKVPGVAHKQLEALEASLTTADTMIKTAEAVPQTRENAKKLGSQIGPALQKVKAAHASVEKVALTTDPLSVKLLKAEQRLGQADTVLMAFNEAALKNEPFATTIAQECIKGAASDRKECMQRKVDGRAQDLDRVVVELDRVVKLLLTNLDVIDPILAVLPDINARMMSLDAYLKLLSPISTNLDNLVDPLRKLEELLDKSFGTSFPYPNPTFTDPLRISYYDVSVRMSTIIQGAGAIEDAIERYLSSVLWEAAKAFGVDKLVNDLVRKANDALNAIPLNLNFAIDLGDIDAVTKLTELLDALGKLDIDYDATIPAIDTSLPAFGLPGVASGIDVKLLDPLWFNPNSLKLTDLPTVPCQQGSYLCN